MHQGFIERPLGRRSLVWRPVRVR